MKKISPPSMKEVPFLNLTPLFQVSRQGKHTLKRVGLKQGCFGSRCKHSRSNSFFELSSRSRTKVFILFLPSCPGASSIAAFLCKT